MESFEIVGEITEVEIIAVGSTIREIGPLRKQYGEAKPTGMKLMEWARRNSNASVTWIRIMKTRFAVCIDNSEYPASLEIHKIYRVIPDEDAERDGELRIVDESGEDYLFPGRYFVAIELPQETVRALMDSFDRT